MLPEETRVYRINTDVDGFIQETFNDSVGARVKKDQKLATYYSPDFLAVASGFLAANERVPGAVGNDGNRTVPFPGAVSKQGVSSIQGFTDRLRNLGMSDVQILGGCGWSPKWMNKKRRQCVLAAWPRSP